MKQNLRLRLSRVISSFQSCRQKTSSSALSPVFFISPANPKKFDLEFPTPPPPPRPTPLRRIEAVVVSTAGCRSCAPVASSSPASHNLSPVVDWGEDNLLRARETPAYLWRKEEKWHVVTCAEELERRRKIDREDEEDQEEDGDDVFPSIFSKIAARRRKREIEIRRWGSKSQLKSRKSTSSVASGSWFSSEDDENDKREYDDDGEDTDTLLSSRSFSTDSTGVFRPCRQCTPPEPSRASTGAAAVLIWLVPCVGEQGGKVKESFAVVKKSKDPRADFRRSMAEMVVEKGMYDAADLEQLLHCFLSLNSRQHHRVIVAAFGDVWEAVFPESLATSE